MAEQPNAAPQPKASLTDKTAQAREEARSGSAPQQGQPIQPNKPELAAEPTPHILQEVGGKLRQAAVGLVDSNKALSQRAQELANQTGDAARINQRSFQHELAYTLQDVERVTGTAIVLSTGARQEVTRLAGSAPGLENEQMRALLRSTAGLEDKGLVREIRRAGVEIGQQADQNTPAIRDYIDNLENKTRLTSKPEAGLSMRQVQPTPELGEASRPSGDPSRAAAPNASRLTNGSPQSPDSRPIVVQGGPTGGIMNGVYRAMRQTGPADTPPWEPGAQSFGHRLSAFEDKMQQGRDDIVMRSVEKSGQAALGAIQGFRNGEGAVVLNRVREAARTDPGGMAGVLAEMREGGKFADLRQQFNTALSDERGATAAYDKAATALARYGEDRKSVEQVIARRPDAANLAAKFETLDKEIGSAAGDLPSRRDGKSMVDDLTKQVAEMLQRAVESIKNLFTRGASNGAAPSGPGPG